MGLGCAVQAGSSSEIYRREQFIVREKQSLYEQVKQGIQLEEETGTVEEDAREAALLALTKIVLDDDLASLERTNVALSILERLS
jgi:hypothetical protein